MHKIRETTSKLWPTPKKGTKYVIVPSHNNKVGIPILIIMRNILGFVKTRKELKKILIDKKILVNNKLIKEENRTLLLFDTLKLKEINKCYRLTFNENGKMFMKEISEKECNTKICKIVDKKAVKNKKIQINFNDGTNILSDAKVNVNDCAVINLDNKKIERIIPIKEKSHILVIKGKYIGKIGEIIKIEGYEITAKSGSGEIKTKIDEVIINE